MYRKTTLENGIRVITETIPAVRSAALGFLIATGPRQDPSGQEGLAHLTEHLMFQGTSSRTAGEIANLMDVGGGNMGGFTTRDYTCYFATVLDEYVTYALDLMGDILLNSIFPEAHLQREQEAILHEISAAHDAPDERVHNLLRGGIWGTHALGRPITGQPDSVRPLTREDIIYFVHEHYTPDRLIVAAAGNINHDDFVAQVRDALWRMLGTAEQETTRTAVAPNYTPTVLVETMPVSQAYFSLALPALPYTHPDRYALHVLNNVLGGGISSRLFTELREERGLVYHVGSEYLAYADAGLWVIEGSTTPECVMPVLALTLVGLWRLFGQDAPITEEEVWKSGRQIRGQHLMAGESSSTRLSRLVTQELYFGRHLAADEVLAAIEGVNTAVLSQMTTQLGQAADQISIAVVGPSAPEHYSQAMILGLLDEFR